MSDNSRYYQLVAVAVVFLVIGLVADSISSMFDEPTGGAAISSEEFQALMVRLDDLDTEVEAVKSRVTRFSDVAADVDSLEISMASALEEIQSLKLELAQIPRIEYVAESKRVDIYALELSGGHISRIYPQGAHFHVDIQIGTSLYPLESDDITLVDIIAYSTDVGEKRISISYDPNDKCYSDTVEFNGNNFWIEIYSIEEYSDIPFRIAYTVTYLPTP